MMQYRDPHTTKKDAKRRLTVIMFADIVGYTAMMENNETEGLEKVLRFREVTKQNVSAFHGKIHQESGDGCLVFFNSTINALKCAKAIQTELQQGNIVPLRIGLHLGDIVEVEGTVYGSSINIASRIEGQAIPGSVLFSHRLKEDIENHPEFESIALGTYVLKNVKKPVELFALNGQGLTIPAKHSAHSTDLWKRMMVAVYQITTLFHFLYV